MAGSSLTNNKVSRRSPCAKDFTASELSAQDFDFSHVPTLREEHDGTQAVPRGREGARPAGAFRGLCSAHYTHWRLVPGRADRPADSIAQQTPCAAAPSCSIRGCDANGTSEIRPGSPSATQVRWAAHHVVGLPSIALAEATLPDPRVLGRGSSSRTSKGCSAAPGGGHGHQPASASLPRNAVPGHCALRPGTRSAHPTKRSASGVRSLRVGYPSTAMLKSASARSERSTGNR
ncbi:hypothetical protein Shyhy02_63340 [Streptomyces hygroscopicus subsp. hygroscopicus]|nr:hypothetical protein Shyhy02_63340 [Streptomyces hygroscopicus subsp. hygroscopicus]